MALWYQPPGGVAVEVNPTDILIVDQGGVTRAVTLDVLSASLIGIRGASSDDEQAQLFAKGVQAIIRLDLIGVTTSTTPAPAGTTQAPASTTSTTTGAPGTPPSSTIVFSNFNSGGTTQAPGSTTSTTSTTAAPGTPPSSTIVFSNFNNNAVAPSATIAFSNFT